MKIAFVVEKFPNLTQTFIFNQIAGVMERGHEVDIYAFGGPSRDIPGIEKDEKFRPFLRRTYYYPLRIPADWLLPLYKITRKLSPELADKLLRWLRYLTQFPEGKRRLFVRFLNHLFPLGGRKPYDVIHCQFGNCGARVIKLQKFGIFQGKLVVSFRGGDISSYIKKRGEQVYDPLFQTGGLFLANCEHFRRRLIRLGCDEKKTLTHGSGIDCGLFSFRVRPAPDSGPIKIVTTARLAPKKGLEYSVRAFAKLRDQYPALEYHIIGEGVLRSDLESLILELGVGKSVKLHGQKKPSEVVDILAQSHLFVAPSITADDGNEDAPVNTLKEAMAMGLPVVATCHGGIPELVEDGASGFLVPERDADAIAEKLEYLIRNPHLWPEMGRRGRAKVEEKYDKEKLNDELVEIYQRL